MEHRVRSQESESRIQEKINQNCEINIFRWGGRLWPLNRHRGLFHQKIQSSDKLFVGAGFIPARIVLPLLLTHLTCLSDIPPSLR